MKWRSLKEWRFIAAEFYGGGRVNPELNLIRFRGWTVLTNAGSLNLLE